MADKLIGSLPEATSIASNDLLVTEQTSIAKKITADNLLHSLDELWTEHGGIESFDLYSQSGLSKTYRMTYADESYTDITITDGTGITDIVTTTSGLTHTITISLNDGTTKVFTVDDGVGISSISAPSTVGLEDTYTINYSDGSTSTFTVTNGASVSSITLNGTTITFTKDDGNMIDLPVPTLRIRYSVTAPDDDNDIITTPSNYMGVAWALDSAVLHYTDYAWFKIKGETGDNAEVSSYTRQYKYDTDGTQAPTTGYYSTIAAAQSAVGGAIQGKYLWIATTVTWNNGTPTVIYSASYQGLDGSGLSGVVKSIYMSDTGVSLSPDSNGQVTISDADIGSIADPATKSDGQVLTWDATDQVWYAGSVSTGTVNSVNSQLPDVGGNVTIYGTNVAMSSTDSTTVKAAIDAKPDDLSDLGVTVSATELNYTDGVTSNIQDQLDAKPDDLADLGITASATELNYTDGVTSNIQDQLDTMAKAVSHTATGAIASFSDGTGNKPVVDLVAEINPVQDLNGYDSPWPAGGGKNKFPTSSFSLGGTSERTINIYFDQPIPVGEYTFSYTKAGTSTVYGIELFGKNGSVASFNSANPVTRTLSEPAIRMYAYMGSTDYSNGKTLQITNIQLEAGSTATAYTPYSNICPITGWTGVNVTRTGKNFFSVPSIELGGTNPRTVNINVATIPAGHYYFSSVKSGTVTNGYGIQFIGNNGLVAQVPINAQSINITEPIIRIYAYMDSTDYSGGKTLSLSDIQLELGSTATTYEPYQGETVTVDWTSEAGTVYGGTIDVATGVLAVNKVMLTFNTADMNNSEAYPGWKNSGIKDLIGSGYIQTFTNQIMNIGTSFSANTMGTDDVLYLGTAVYNKTQSEWIALAQDVQILVELATTITYQLTPQEVKTLLGTNNIWADTGDITVRYIDVDSDLSDYFVEKSTYKSGQLLQDRNLAYVERGTRASRAYSVNKYFINADGVLCRITASVSSGGTLIKGSNYIVVTGGLANDLYSLLH